MPSSLTLRCAAFSVQIEGADGRTHIEQAGGCGGFGKGNFTALFKSIEVPWHMSLVF